MVNGFQKWHRHKPAIVYSKIMECREINLEVCPPAEDEEEGGVDRAATCELEAAEALAGLARVSEAAAGSSRRPSQDRPTVAQQIHDHTSCVTTSSERIESFVENTQTQLCSTTGQSKSMGKSRHKLTEMEKEQRKLRRILENRESARETIRRRKAMHQDLTRKAAEVLEENEILKKEKELAVGEYNSLKARNEFLKAQLAKIKKNERGEMRKVPGTSSSQTLCPANITAPLFLHNLPSVVPCVWPSILPSSEVLQFQCASGSNVMCSTQFPMLHRNAAGLHQGQENIAEINRPGAPIFVVAVPWLLPCLAQSNTADLHSGSNNGQNADTGVMHEDNFQLSSNQYLNTGSSDSIRHQSVDVCELGFTHSLDGSAQQMANHPMDNAAASHVRSVESHTPMRNFQSDNRSDARFVNAPARTRHSFAATEARRKRKEMLKLKKSIASTIACSTQLVGLQ